MSSVEVRPRFAAAFSAIFSGVCARVALGCAFVAVGCPVAARAEPAKVEIGVEGAALNGGQSDWLGTFGTVAFDVSGKDRLTFELGYASRFSEQAGVLTGSWQRNYSEDSYQISSVTGSTAGEFFPSFGLSTEYFHKVGADRSWIVGGGAGGSGFRTGNQDYFGVLEVIRYFAEGWVGEVGTRLNLGTPGSVTAPRGFAAVSWLPAEGMEFVLKVDGGQEAYQLVGPDNVQEGFASLGVTQEAFVPIGGGRQIHGRVEEYFNPTYDRVLAYLGVSQSF